MNKTNLKNKIEQLNKELNDVMTQLSYLEEKEQTELNIIRNGKAEEIVKLEKVLGKQGSAPQPDTIRGLLAYQPDDLESFTGVALTLILSAVEQSTQATINALKMLD